MFKILVIVASTRPGRKGRAVGEWFIESVKHNKELAFELIDLADINLPLLDEPLPPIANQYKQEHTKKWASVIAPADGFVFVTPEYNHGYPPSLKNAVDFLYKEWVHKPVAFVSYGVTGGLRAVEQMRQVIVQLQMVAVNAQVALNLGGHFDEAGKILPDKHTENDLKQLIEQLSWWTKVLADGRARY